MKVFYLQKSQVPKQCLCNMIWIGVFTLYTIEIFVKGATDDVFQNDRWDLVKYRKTSYISRTLVGYKIVDNPDVVGASPVGAAPTTSSFST